MITKHGKAALQKRLPIPCEITRDSVSELVFSLRSKRRFRKARLEAARWVMRTTFALRVFCINFQSHSFLFHSCTRDFHVALA